MKKVIIITGILAAMTSQSIAQAPAENNKTMNKKFVAAMEANLALFDTASAYATFITLANNFERIGKAEQKQWQPFYYAALCYATIAANSPDKSKIDLLTEKSEAYLGIADILDNNNSEVSTLRGMILYLKVQADPISRWQTIGKEAGQQLAKARQQNPANPRPYLIEARAKLYTPEAMGGGINMARPVAEECLAKYKTFEPENSIAPNWGRMQGEKLLSAINAR